MRSTRTRGAVGRAATSTGAVDARPVGKAARRKGGPRCFPVWRQSMRQEHAWPPLTAHFPREKCC
eukprot:1705293-Prymnesium_polylepis.1